jgi:hypothetical protein
LGSVFAVARVKVRPQREVVERCEALRLELRAALDRLPADATYPAVVDAVWHGEALGTLLWALQLAELPPYDRPFAPDELAALETADGELRPAEELELERETARLWHWRARTSELAAAGGLALPDRISTIDQLVAATAMRGYDRGLLPAPLRGDFRAFGKIYRHLAADELAQLHSIAVERHHALAWLCGEGESWDEVPLDT